MVTILNLLSHKTNHPLGNGGGGFPIFLSLLALFTWQHHDDHDDDDDDDDDDHDHEDDDDDVYLLSPHATSG